MSSYDDDKTHASRLYIRQTALNDAEEQRFAAAKAQQQLLNCLEVLPTHLDDGHKSHPFQKMLMSQLAAAKKNAQEHLTRIRKLLPAQDAEVQRLASHIKTLSYDRVTVILPSNRTRYTEGIVEAERQHHNAGTARDATVELIESLVAAIGKASKSPYSQDEQKPIQSGVRK
jgi:hypothetical protein